MHITSNNFIQFLDSFCIKFLSRQGFHLHYFKPLQGALTGTINFLPASHLLSPGQRIQLVKTMGSGTHKLKFVVAFVTIKFQFS